MSPAAKRMELNKRVTCIENLPPEMINELFEYLHPKDLAACSMVNKRWHSVFVAFKLHRLVVSDFDPFGDFSRWYSSNQPIQETERCSLAMFRRLAKKPLLSNLKYLVLHDYDPESDLKKLKRFRQLVHLEINIDLADYDEVWWKINLNLPKLRVLAFHGYNKLCSVSIDCPELHTLLYDDDSEDAWPLKVKHPETIRKLDTNMVGPKLDPFKGVECLVINQFGAITPATLLSLPRLRELRCDSDIQYFSNDSLKGTGTVDQSKRKLSEFVDEAKRLRGAEFRFFFAGFELTNVNVDQIDFCVQVNEGGHYEWVYNEYIYLKNYHLIEPGALSFVRQVDYTRLLNNMTGEFPRCFFQKFTGIKRINATAEVQDAGQFLWFLKSLRFLKILDLKSTGLSQEFYNQLPASVRSLTSLHLEASSEPNGLQLNFDFVAEFSYLAKAIIRSLSMELLSSFVRSVKLANVNFHVLLEDCSLWIEKKKGSTVWKISDFDRTLFEFENADEIVNFFEGRQAASLESDQASN